MSPGRLLWLVLRLLTWPHVYTAGLKLQICKCNPSHIKGRLWHDLNSTLQTSKLKLLLRLYVFNADFYRSWGAGQVLGRVYDCWDRGAYCEDYGQHLWAFKKICALAEAEERLPGGCWGYLWRRPHWRVARQVSPCSSDRKDLYWSSVQMMPLASLLNKCGRATPVRIFQHSFAVKAYKAPMSDHHPIRKFI